MRALAVLCTLALAATASAAPFDKSGIADWTKPPAATAEPGWKPPTVKRSKLANGMALLVVENHKLPIVAFDLIVPGAGAAADPASKGGLAAFTADMLDEGAGGLSALQIAQEEDRLGAALVLYAGTDSAGLSGKTLTKTLDPTIDLLTAIVTKPAFDPAELERVKGDRMTSLELRRDRPREVAALALEAQLYGADTPYGHPPAGVREQFKALAVPDVQQFYRDHWNPAVMTLVVAGDFDPKALAAKLDAGLGAWRPAGAKRPTPPVVRPKKLSDRLVLVNRPGAAQSDVRFGLVALDRKDRRYYAFEVLATTLGGGFTSRLVQRLREKLGITYGARAGMEWHLQPGPFVISTAIVTKATAQGVDETLKMVDALATTEVPLMELEKSKQNLVRALPARFETNGGVAGQFAELALFGLPDDWYAHYADAVRKVTAKDVLAVAKATVPAKQLVISIVGDMGKVRADLDKLGLGTAATRDPYGMSAR